MNDYVQPDFYRFNQDSLDLVKFIIKRIAFASHILDLGAGSGVIGIEISNKLNPEKLTLLETQSEFLPFLQENLKHQLKVGISWEIIHNSFGGWKSIQEYDLIVCNPPYYLPGHGQLSDDPRKGIARSFQVDDWTTLMNCIDGSLSPQGSAFLVFKGHPLILKLIQDFSLHKFLVSQEQSKELFFLQLSRLNKD